MGISYAFSFAVVNFSGNRHDALLQVKIQLLYHEIFSQSRVLSLTGRFHGFGAFEKPRTIIALSL